MSFFSFWSLNKYPCHSQTFFTSDDLWPVTCQLCLHKCGTHSLFRVLRVEWAIMFYACLNENKLYGLTKDVHVKNKKLTEKHSYIFIRYVLDIKRLNQNTFLSFNKIVAMNIKEILGTKVLYPGDLGTKYSVAVKLSSKDSFEIIIAFFRCWILIHTFWQWLTWYNIYCYKKWTQKPKIKSWMGLFAFQFMLIFIGKAWTHFFSLHTSYWYILGKIEFFYPWLGNLFRWKKTLKFWI